MEIILPTDDIVGDKACLVKKVLNGFYNPGMNVSSFTHSRE
jgi:hypothetical protein